MKKESACSLLIAELCFSYHCHLGTDEVSRTAPHVLLLVFAVTWCEPSAPKCTNNNPRGAHSREEGLQLADLCRDRPAIALQLGCKYNTGKARIWMLQKKKEDCFTQQWGWNPMLLWRQRTLAVRARQQRRVAAGCCVRLLWHETIVKDRWIGCVWFVSYGLSVLLYKGDRYRNASNNRQVMHGQLPTAGAPK